MEPQPTNPVVESARVVGRYVSGQATIVAILTVVYAAGFAWARMPLWPVVAIVAALSHVVPVVGVLFGLGAIGLAGLGGEFDTTRWLIAFGTWIFAQGLEGFVLTPKILGDRLGLSALLVFAAIVVGGFVLGPIGMMIAVPALAVARIFWRHLRPPSRVPSALAGPPR